jgi:predicted chitinase
MTTRSLAPNIAVGEPFLPEATLPPPYRVGALYKNKDPLEIQRAQEEHGEEVARALSESAPLLTVEDLKMAGNPFTVKDLRECMPNLPEAKAREYFPHLVEALKKWKVDSFERVAQFLGAIGHESADLYYWKEINGEDQWYAPWYGRGPIQITHRENYARIANAIGQPLLENPDLLYKPEIGFDAACAFFSGHNPQGRDLRVEADWGNFETIMFTILGAVNHPSYADRWNRYIRASRALSIPFFLDADTGHTTNFERALAWLWPLLGRMPYGWWIEGEVPEWEPAFAENAPVPKIEDLAQATIFCVGPINLIRRHARKVIPTAGDDRFDGGTVACWAYWSRYMRKFNIDVNYPHGTLVFRRYNPVTGDQGHAAIVLGNWRVLQSFDGNEPMEGGFNGPGLNARASLEASNDGDYFEYALWPGDWINHNRSTAPWAT